jgi:hypothetical protein
MPRKKQIVKVKKTQKQKQKVNVVVNVNSNNKKKNVVSRQPKMIQQSFVPQVIHIQAPTPQVIANNEQPKHIANSQFMQTMGQAPYRTNVIPETPPIALPFYSETDRFPVQSNPQTPVTQRRPRTTIRGVALFQQALNDLPAASSDTEPDPLKEERNTPSQLSQSSDTKKTPPRAFGTQAQTPTRDFGTQAQTPILNSRADYIAQIKKTGSSIKGIDRFGLAELKRILDIFNDQGPKAMKLEMDIIKAKRKAQ